ncbi:MAG: class I SAM-dependent methyltransferase [Desulfobulbaceae bacterium]|nr:class I SAM-dependent methyltransferase [Desulfobulbaceae bacterium]
MFPVSSISVSSTINSATILQKAEELAAKLNLPLTPSIEHRLSEVILAYTAEGLQLLHIPHGSQKSNCLLFVDFVHGKNAFRLAQNRTTKQAIARAVGVKSGFRPTILDGTAGLGADSFVLASLDCSVTMCERSPIIGALLEDGLYRAKKEQKTAEIIETRMNLVQGDTQQYLQKTSAIFHTIYLDPMYPHSNKSALNKQTLRIIRSLVGGDPDGAELLETALKKAKNRVVVKRPRQAPQLSDLQPSHVILMKNSRFDIYLTFNS